MSSHIRLLACSVCKTIEELPDYEGSPDHDHLLNRLLERHGPPENRHTGLLFKVDEDQWQNEQVKTQVAQQIAQKMSGGDTGFSSEYYDLKNTFAADALDCFKAHHRNPNCSDFQSESKRLTPGTAQDRREAGLPEYRSPKDRYLCNFCPVQSMVDQAARAKAGLYK